MLLVVTALALALSASASAAHIVATLKLGQTRTFTSAESVPGDKVACVGDGKRLALSFPAAASGNSDVTISNVAFIRGLSLQILARFYGSYTAVCSKAGTATPTAPILVPGIPRHP